MHIKDLDKVRDLVQRSKNIEKAHTALSGRADVDAIINGVRELAIVGGTAADTKAIVAVVREALERHAGAMKRELKNLGVEFDEPKAEPAKPGTKPPTPPPAQPAAPPAAGS